MPATMGTRSKKPIEELRRPDGLSATSVGFAMLRVGPKNLFGKVVQCNSTRGWLLRSRKNPPVGPLSGRVASQTAVSAPF